MNEAQTGLELIDPAQRDAGWCVIEGSKIRVEFPINFGRLIGQGRRANPLKADYILEYKKKRLALIETKAMNQYYTDGLGQAKDYTELLNIYFTYDTNGFKI